MSLHNRNASWQPSDSLTLAALLLLTAAWIALKIHWTWSPLEDAAILLRYSQNLAAGHGIRWSLNQPPVDGATDFLFMVLTAALTRLTHLDVVTTSRLIDILAQFASVALLYTGARALGGSRVLSAAATLCLIAGPFINLTNACTGAPLFAFFLLAGWSAALRFTRSPSWPNALAVAALGLLAGLTRPEGVLVALLILLATVWLTRATPSLPGQPHSSPHGAAPAPAVPAASTLLLSHLLVFALLGAPYFLWHWHYFGYPLPNPFYVKGGGHLYLGSLPHAAMNLVVLLLPALPLLPLGWLSPRTRPLLLALLLILVPFTLMWVLLSNANNAFARFQYAIVPLVFMTTPALAQSLADAFPVPPLLPRWPGIAATVLAVLAAMLYVNHIAEFTYTAFGMRTFAQRLQPLADRGYTMAVTEAGTLPLYAQWNTLDALGLDDAYVAHHHYLDAPYLDRAHPELIMSHVDVNFPGEFGPNGLAYLPTRHDPAFNAEFLNYYAASHGYVLAAAYGSDPCNLHVYWLRPDFPDFPAVLADIRDHPYYFLDNGHLSFDYRNHLAETRPCADPAPDHPAPNP